MQKITPFLWFDNNGEEAINFYALIFKNAKIHNISRYPEGGPMPGGMMMSATFELEGQQFMALNGGPGHPFTDAISLFIDCQTQEEVDALWEKLTADGGEPGPCGWCKDKYGLSWQVIPRALGELLSDPDPVKAQNVMGAMLQMQKIDIAKLQEAYDRVGV